MYLNHPPALHWLVRVTERWRGRGELPGSKPKLIVPATKGGMPLQDDDGCEDELDDDDDTEMIEYGRLIEPLTLLDVVAESTDVEVSSRGRQAVREITIIIFN